MNLALEKGVLIAVPNCQGRVSVPHAVHQNHSVDRTAYWALGSFMVMFFLQRFFPHHHHDVAEGAPEQHRAGLDSAGHQQAAHAQSACGHTLAEQSASRLSWAATTMGMAFHSLLGGVALAAAVVAGGDKAQRLSPSQRRDRGLCSAPTKTSCSAARQRAL